MPFRLIIVLSIIFICPDIIAQNTNTINRTERDYMRFHETLEKEIKNTGRDTGSYSGEHVLHPAHLPYWIFQLPESNQQTVYAIGISDPGMEENNAYKLAELRAKSIIAVLLHPAVAGVTDNFSNERVNPASEDFTAKYVDYNRIVSTLYNCDINTEIVERFFTSFNEAIVLAKYKPVLQNEVTDSIIVIVGVYQAERQKSDNFEIEEKFEITSNFINDTCDDVFNYSFQALNNLFEISSDFNNEELKLKN
ncbi:MAG: hypothetical protein B6D61_14855 [Bacteroidetes bacterium 4484_249]|nr:MAG: hypothetical protein B6D61_14855 [Bacteroidetes bacterium 4484_249]